MSEYDLDALKAAVAKMQEIAADYAEFDGDRRGIYECLSDAEWKVSVAVAKGAPTLLTDAALGRALRAAAERDGPEREAMVERVARIMWRDESSSEHAWDDADERDKDHFCYWARAALAAVKEAK